MHFCGCRSKELKGKFLIKGKRLNKLDDAFNNTAIEDGTVSEEDEAADCKENGQKGKSKVSKVELLGEMLPGMSMFFFFSS